VRYLGLQMSGGIVDATARKSERLAISGIRYCAPLAMRMALLRIDRPSAMSSEYGHPHSGV